ncbi:MAG: hypothetical protein E7623_07490 [Ruminococcaceae bacterium]|nr:hypothetical protein [Oscillospiraceae bacterium]
MRDYSHILYGNTDLADMVIRDARNGVLSHAYIIEGDSGSGKKTLAGLMASALACGQSDGPCLECDTCKKIREGQCPDVSFITCPKGKKTIGVDVIRSLKKSAYITPNDIDCKVYIIEDAHLMTTEAQNAFLKLLEEPPQNVYFFLLCEDLSGVLPTVKSRTALLRMQKFGFEELSEYILSRSKKAKSLYESARNDFDFNVRASRGSIGELKKRFSSQSESALKKYEQIKKTVELLCKTGRAEFLVFFSKLGDNREQLLDIYECLAFAFRDLMYIKKSKGDDLMFFTDRAEASAFVMKYTQNDAIRLIAATEMVREELMRNVNVSNAQIKLAMEMWDIKHRA